ncbi:unnamed protein product [Phaedon cochleariae]|uniref:Ankyrin repeat protein n=1 Tax=Phaedon cochleariae TaxID=80249 RepID=A0A9P0D7P2_PHACE|nr:unnamed protein product [Phaedon cochleariae]
METEIPEDIFKNNFEENCFGQTVLHFVVRMGKLELTCNIIQKGGKINKLDHFDNTPLSLACIEKPNKDIVEVLLRAGANVHFERHFHMDLFLECVMYCTSSEQLEIINLLLEKGINVNVTDSIWNRNCIHLVAISGYKPLATILLSHGAILHIKDNLNYTPTELASIHGNIELLELFSSYSETPE